MVTQVGLGMLTFRKLVNLLSQRGLSVDSIKNLSEFFFSWSFVY